MKHYSKQFKDEAMALALESECPYSQIAQDLDVNLPDIWQLDDKGDVRQTLKIKESSCKQARLPIP